jgi:hypothetical protein
MIKFFGRDIALNDRLPREIRISIPDKDHPISRTTI